MKNYKKKPKMEGKFMTKQYDKTRRNMSKSGEKAFKKGQTNAMTAAASLIPIGQAASAIGIAAKGALQARKAARMRKLIDGAIRKNKSITPIKTKQPDVSKFLFPRMKRPEAPLQNGKELKPIMIKPNMGRIIKPMAKFPDLSGDGKVTQKDILIGKGVIDKPKYGKKPKMYNKPKQQKDLKKKTNAALEAAIKQKKTGKTDPTIVRVIGDPEKMKQDIAKLDSMRASFKSKKDSIVARGKMSAKDRAKSVRDEFKDFFNNSPKMYNKPKMYKKKK